MRPARRARTRAATCRRADRAGRRRCARPARTASGPSRSRTSSPPAGRPAAARRSSSTDPRRAGVTQRHRPHAHAYTIARVLRGAQTPAGARRRDRRRRQRASAAVERVAGDAGDAAGVLDDVEPDDALASAWYRATVLPSSSAGTRRPGGGMKLTVNGVAQTVQARRSPRSCTRCARSSTSRAPRPAASRAAAVPARCSSTASPDARACCLAAVDGAEITTVEGLGSAEELSPVQAAFDEHYAAQCGYCTSGLIMAATALIDRTAKVDPRGDPRGLSGHVCRCTGYIKIVGAVDARRGATSIPRRSRPGCSPRSSADPREPGMKAVGARLPRYDGVAHVTGQTQYVDDIRVAARSGRRRCARRTSTRRSSASTRARRRRSPGVHAIVTTRTSPTTSTATSRRSASPPTSRCSPWTKSATRASRSQRSRPSHEDTARERST